MIVKSILRIVSFLLSTFLIADFLIIIRVLFRNYGNKLECSNIKNTIIIFGLLTVILFLIKLYLLRKVRKLK